MSYISKGTIYGLFEKQVLTPDGVKDTFDLTYRPGLTGAILVINDGVIQEPQTSYNLIDGGRKVKLSYIPTAGSQLYVLYMGRELSIPTVAGNYPVHISAVGDGINAQFTLNPTPVEPALLVFKNGTLLRHATNWTLTGNTLTFNEAPAVGDLLDFYIHGVERCDLVSVDDGAITNSKLNLCYVPYTPDIQTFKGMNCSTPEFTVSKFLPIGKSVKIRLLFKTTFGGDASDSVRFTLPPGLENDGTTLVTGSVTLITSSVLETGVLRWGGLNSIDIKRQGGIDFTLDEWTFEIAMEYEIS